MDMSPMLETNVVGRHGQVGVEVLPHEPQVLQPEQRALRQVVDDLFDRIENPARRTEREVSAETTRHAVEVRGAQIAVADMVRIESVV